MDTQTLLLILLALTAAIAVLLAVQGLRRPAGAMERALREERDRLARELETARAAAAAAGADAARQAERAARVDAQAQELAALQEALQRQAEASAAVRVEAAAQASELAQARQRAERAEAEAAQLRAQLEALRGAHADAQANLSHSERTNAEMKAFLDTAQARLSAVFAELAGKTFEERSLQAAQQSKGDLAMLLKPFSEQLDGFRARVDLLYGEEARQRATLAGKIDELKTLNQDMAQRAHELTRALKGNAKIRGDWGELMLENVLQGSGLVEGAHYLRQKAGTDDEGQRLLPDIVVVLPDERRVVVDSKVNLVAWQEAMNAAEPEQQTEAMRRHALALRQHVKDLGDKNYPRWAGEGALEVTIAFVPIEGALSAALGFDAALQTYAFERKVVFASPNTLMALLRVVERLWTRDKIQREAAEIAKAGGLVLDSLTNFLSDFDNVGRQLDDARSAFNAARGRLSDSNQALIPRARRLAELGAKGRKALPGELLADPDAVARLPLQRDE